MDDDNLYASPESDVSVSEHGELASRGDRLMGAIIDGLLAAGIISLMMYQTGYFTRAFEESISLTEAIVWPVVGFVLYLGLNGYLLATAGQTIGKRIVGTRIVSIEDGKILPLSKLLMLRVLPFSLVAQVPLLGPAAGFANVLFIFGDARRCLHDYVAGTRVIKA